MTAQTIEETPGQMLDRLLEEREGIERQVLFMCSEIIARVNDNDALDDRLLDILNIMGSMNKPLSDEICKAMQIQGAPEMEAL